MICCIFLWKIFFDILFLLIIRFLVVVVIFIEGGGEVMDEFVFELDVDIVFFFFNWSCRDI